MGGDVDHEEVSLPELRTLSEARERSVAANLIFERGEVMELSWNATRDAEPKASSIRPHGLSERKFAPAF